MTDADGNVYSAVKIGKQVWMAENLRTTKFNDGSAIPRFADSTASEAPPSLGYCYYNNMTIDDSIKKFGALYNWYTKLSSHCEYIAVTLVQFQRHL